MARKVFISFLGTSNYIECKYRNGETVSKPVRFVQEALITDICKDWADNDQIYIFCTSKDKTGEKGAKEFNWLNNGQDKATTEVERIGLEQRLKDLRGKMNLKPEVEEVDILERYHKRHRKQNSEWDLKIERVKRALDMKDGNMTKPEDYSDKRKYWSKFKIKGKHPGVKRSAFNNSIFRSMLKYFKPEIKSKIIALQIVDRFEMKKNEMNNIQEEDENNEDGNSRKIFA